MTDVLGQMIAALDLEVAAIRKKGGGSRVELRGGERIGVSEGSILYRFIVTEDLNLRDDTPVRVTCGQEDVAGILVSFRDGVLVIALEKDLGPKIPMARLVANDSFLIERLKERLTKVQSGEAQFNTVAAQRVLGRTEPKSDEVEPHPDVIRDGKVNAEQLDAIRRSLGSDTTYVWGPPGTGKTTTLARIVEAHYRAGRTVLLVSNTNIAVDTALEKVADRLKGENDFHQGLVIRQGPVVKEELRQRYGSQVILDEIVARLGESLRVEKEKLIGQMAPLEKEISSFNKALQDYKLVDEARNHLASCEKTREAARSKLSAKTRELEQLRSEAERLVSELTRARNMSKLQRLFSLVNIDKLEREAAQAENAVQAAAQAAKALAADLPNVEGQVIRAQQMMDNILQMTRHYPPVAEIRQRIAGIQSHLTEMRHRLSVIDQQINELEQQVLSRCKILATTVYRTYLGKTTTRPFDVVVIDEASMLMPPLVFYAAGLSNHAVVVAGDFRQLPPIVMSDENPSKEWLKRDVFEIAGIPTRVLNRQLTPSLVSLSTQYRMREPICAVINQLFYTDHPLRSDPSVRLGGEGFPFPAAPLLYVNTAPFHPWTALRLGTFSRYNLFHALLVRNILLHLAETGFLPPAGKPNDAVGAISPYASQARLIQALLEDRLKDRAAGLAATVHRFQGNEKSAIVLDLTDSFGSHLGHFLKATRLEEDGARLLNVAASRAKHHLILVANFDFIQAHAPDSSFVLQMLELFEEKGEELNLNSLLPLADRDWVDGLHRVHGQPFDFPDDAAGAFTEGTFYPVFLRDIERARKSIVIFSPFATQAGTARWMDALRLALSRNVRVRILTRPPNEPGGGGSGEVSQLVDALRDLGVTVDLRARMHEKIAILDGRILWHGSLNILSHRDTHESMLRIDSPAACSQVGRFVSTPGGFGDSDEPTINAPENPECPKCGGATIWKEGRYGIYFECEAPHCDGKVNARRRHRGDRDPGSTRGRSSGSGRKGKSSGGESALPCPQPGCDGNLMVRKGKFGQFLGCSNYPRCRYTQNKK